MPSTQHAHRQGKPASKKRVSRSSTQDLDALREQKYLATIIQQARLDPRSLTPRNLLQLQPRIGNQAVSRLLSEAEPGPGANKAYRSHLSSSPNRIQRYFTHTPGLGEATALHFEAQERDPATGSFLTAGTDSPRIRPPTAAPVGIGAAAPTIPQLRVSNDGNLAIEGTDLSARQAKVFFATQGIVDESNARLLEINSPIRLEIDQANALRINTVHNVHINKQLNRVVPKDVAQNVSGVSLDLKAGPNCDEVAEKVAQVGPIPNAAVQATGVDPAVLHGAPEYRLARYIINRQAGDNHLTALGKLSNPVSQADIDTLSQQYAEIAEPTVTFATKIRDRLIGTHAATPYAALDTALGHYTTRRTAGADHVTAQGATLGGLGLTPSVLASIEKGYNHAKIDGLVTQLHTTATTTPLPPTAEPLPDGLDQAIRKYVQQRLEQGIPHAGAKYALRMKQSDDQHNVVIDAIDTAYTAHVGTPPAGLTAVDFRNQILELSPNAGLEYALLPYVRSRLSGNPHATALASLPANMHATVTANLDAAYNAVILTYNPTAKAAQLSTWLQGLGINQFAAPEVGQIFGSASTGLPDVDKKLTIYKTGAKVGTSAEAWGGHYGTVVARSGGDSITLENYARVAENVNLAGGGGETKEYYFQMYGSDAGQSWHEAWASAQRPTVNPITMVIGKDKKVVWKEQLEDIPAFEPDVNPGGFQAQLATEKGQIDAAPSVNAAKVVYYAALTSLILSSIAAHRARANQVGRQRVSNLAPANLSPANAIPSGRQIATEIDAWIVTHQTKLDKKWKINIIGKARLKSSIAKLTGIRDKLRALVTYHDARHV